MFPVAGAWLTPFGGSSAYPTPPFEADRRFAEAGLDLFYLPELLVDFAIHPCLMIVVVCQAIKNHFDHFSLSASDVRHASRAKLVVRVGNGSHRLQPSRYFVEFWEDFVGHETQLRQHLRDDEVAEAVQARAVDAFRGKLQHFDCLPFRRDNPGFTLID
jgi:hypothetical protein